DGRVPDEYPLLETTTDQYAERTALNVRDSDGTLVLTIGAPIGGTAYTIACAQRFDKPYLVCDLTQQADAARVRQWLDQHRIAVLNVAGPRRSENPEGYDLACQFLRVCLAV